MDLPLLNELVTIFCLSILVIYGCHKIKIPPVVGFLLTGVVCGPYGLGLVSAVHEVELMAEIGIVLLMFSIGMELSVSELIRLRKPVFIGGALQVGLTILAVVPVAVFALGSLNRALFAGFLAALSSTAIVLKILQQSGQMESPHGRISLSILIFQDLIIVPMVLAVPLLAGKGLSGGGTGTDLLLSGLKTVGLMGGGFLLARKLVPAGLSLVVRTRSRELFLISTLGICLSIALITSALGLSLSLGAFMAGLIMSESEYSHSALEGILPFKEVFTSLFFTSVGMLLHIGFFTAHLAEIAAVTFFLMFCKTLVVLAVGLLLGYPLRPALIAGLALCQIGEFSFVLARAGYDNGLFEADFYQIFLAASIATMIAAPFLIAVAPRFAAAVAGLPIVARLTAGKVRMDEEEAPKDTALRDHLIIIGFGISGKYLARTAKLSGIPYTILEMNPDTVRAYAAVEPISYGDATHPSVLRALGVAGARVLAVVISDPAAVRGITEAARHMAPGLHIVVRTRFLAEVEALRELGASDVIPEEFETAVEIFTRVLSRYLVPRADIEGFVRDVRSENYAMARDLNVPGAPLNVLRTHMPEINVTAVGVEERSPLDGTSLADSELRPRHGLTVMGIRRGDEAIVNPDGSFVFRAGDIAYVFASSEAVSRSASLFSGGGD